MGRCIGEEHLQSLAAGSAFLGAGGGGDPYTGYLVALSAVRRYGAAQLRSLEDIDDKATLCVVAGFGAPTVSAEKLASWEDMDYTLSRLEYHLGRRVDGLLAAEVGGCNSLLPVALAARRGLPLIDGDGMGRAFPELQMTSYCIGGVGPTPLVIADEHGNAVTLDCVDPRKAEALARTLALQMGLRAYVAGYVMDAVQARRCVITGTLSIALAIGDVLHSTTDRQGGAVQALLACLESTTYYRHARCLFAGKIVDVQRRTQGGFAVGECRIEAPGGGRDSLVVAFQNENLVARRGDRPVALVPDLICIVDGQTAQPLTTPELRYGQRVAVLGASAPPALRTPAALQVVGPRAFGLDMDYMPIEDFP